MPPCPSRVPEPTIPGPGPHDRGVPAALAEHLVQRSGRGDGLPLAAECGAGGQMAGEQPLRAQRGDGLRAAAGERAPLGLDVAEPGSRPCAGERPRDRRELAVQREHRDRPAERHAQLLARLHRRDRVLQARVVELHHVQFSGARGVEPACEVDVDEVEPAGAEAEIDRLDVDDDLVADLAGTDERDVGDRRPRRLLALERRLQALLAATAGGRRVGLVERLPGGASASARQPTPPRPGPAPRPARAARRRRPASRRAPRSRPARRARGCARCRSRG